MSAQRAKFWIAGFLIVGSFLYLGISGFKSQNFIYFLTIDEVAAQATTLGEQGIRVQGKIVPRSLAREPEAMRVSFRLQGEKATLAVRFTGVPPDLLENGFPVIAEGKLGPGGVLVAKNLMVACPSKFEEKREAGEKIPEKHDTLMEGAQSGKQAAARN